MIARIKMAAFHLLCSGIVVGLVMSVIYFIWYPYPYYIFHDTFSATKLVVMVDLVLGPLLTLIVFNTAKPLKELKRDLLIIVLVQVSALGWGIYITHSVRPLFAVYFNGEIHSITEVSFDNSGFDPSVKVPGIFERPKLVYISPFSNEDYKLKMVKQMKGEELGFVLQTRLYETINDDTKKNMFSRALSREQLTKRADYKLKLMNFLKHKNISFDDVLFYPVTAGPYNAVAVIDKKTMDVIETLDIYIKNSSEY